MTIQMGKSRYALALAMLAGVVMAFWWGVCRLRVNTDITAALPRDDKVVAAAEQILRHHPGLDNIFVQISISGSSANREDLVKAADLASDMLSESGLVKVVSGGGAAGSFAALLDTVTENLPLLLSEEDLREKVGDLIQPSRVESLVEGGFRQLLDLGSVGQAHYFSKDPLGLRNLFLARLSPGQPFKGMTLEQGYILSNNDRHVLLIARPTRPSQDASFARAMTEVLERVESKLKEFSSPEKKRFTMVYAGAFRASLDNERMIRQDTSRALALVMISLIFLAFLSFRRPWLGLLSAVPAVAGTVLTVFVYALTGKAIFSVAMGFGGALIGIAVDHGLAFVVLLDRPAGAEARRVARDVWAVGTLPLLSTLAALLSLTAINIPLFAQVGLFAALGVGLSALFAHLFFPLLFPVLGPSKREKPLPLERLMDRVTATSSWWTAGACAALALVMLFFVRIQFNVDLASMNTLSKETLKAEQALEEAWGSMSARPSIMVRSRTLQDLLVESDHLAQFLERERRSSVLGQETPRSMLLPGPRAQQRHLKAWSDFWTRERVLSLEHSLNETAAKLGLKSDAFEPFVKMLHRPVQGRLSFPQEFLAAFGVFSAGDRGEWVIVDTLSPGPNYDPSLFFNKAQERGFLFFDPTHFSRHMTGQLNRSFMGILLIVMGVTVVLLFFFFLDWQILLLSLTPIVFSFIATLGTMGLLGLPLSMPSLMLAPLIVGLGLDYGIYFVRSYQRFGPATQPGSEGFRVTVLLCGLTTLVGFGSLLFAKHAVLRDAGVSTFFGIFYAMAGTFWIVPPVLRFLFAVPPAPRPPSRAGSKEHTRLTLRRFEHLEPYPRLFARFKILLDPMFPRLSDFVKPGWKLLDVGCGFGVPAAWLLTLHPDLKFVACDPSAERARIAGRVLGERAKVLHGGALDLPLDPVEADAVLLLDVLHHFQDKEMIELLARLRAALSREGRLIIRVTLPGTTFRLFRFVEETRFWFKGMKPCWRGKENVIQILGDAGFSVELVEATAHRREETWFIGVRNQ
jgi:predicted RND superfamily exporter protein/SAM-dependent methyltransferase